MTSIKYPMIDMEWQVLYVPEELMNVRCGMRLTFRRRGRVEVEILAIRSMLDRKSTTKGSWVLVSLSSR